MRIVRDLAAIEELFKVRKEEKFWYYNVRDASEGVKQPSISCMSENGVRVL